MLGGLVALERLEMSKVDQRHLQCLKEEEKFLMKLQHQLLNQQKLLKVEEASLLKLMSSASNSNTGPKILKEEGLLPGNVAQAGTGQECFLGDTAVNVAPLSLNDLAVPTEKGAKDIEAMSTFKFDEKTDIIEEEDADISEHDEEDN